jgi:chromosome segregation ATPase
VRRAAACRLLEEESMTTTTRREEYLEETRKKLEEWSAHLDQLEGRIDRARETSKQELKRELERTRHVHAAARTKLDELREAGRESAAQIEEEAEHFVRVLDRSVQYFRSQL